MVDSEETCDSAVIAAEALLDALGIRYNVKAPKKRTPFSESFKILGVELTIKVVVLSVADHYGIQGSRLLKVTAGCKPAWLFTDAAVEADTNGKGRIIMGGLIYESTSVKPVVFLYTALRSSIGQTWAADAPSQPICQAETCAVTAAMMLWSRRLEDRKVVDAVDIVGTQMALIRMVSNVPSIASMLKTNFGYNFRYKLHCWYSWTPSASNPADAPSRLDTKELA
eukprot:1793406-Amphidinium_carterae.2